MSLIQIQSDKVFLILSDHSCMHSPIKPLPLLDKPFSAWFEQKGWILRPHQEEMIRCSDSAALLLVAPTGGGKTLAGFLPSLIELQHQPTNTLHTLYVSPLKALAADIERNLKIPVTEMNLPIRIETRTADTSQSVRKRQRLEPPQILLTTPESLALMLSYPEAATIFGDLQRVIFDEIHALSESKRGDQLMLCAARLQKFSASLRRVGLSATIRSPERIIDFMAYGKTECRLIHAKSGTAPEVKMLYTAAPPPWSGGGALYAAPDVLKEITKARTALVFINTRAQAEIFFQALWQENSEGLPIAIHHGSLSREARSKVESAMLEGSLRAIVCTGTLDLGIDWGDVDLVIQVGAPKNVKRLVQRIGRSNHRYDTPSKALIVPANRFEVIECRAALDAIRADELDDEIRLPAPRDVLCQHIMIMACSAPFDADCLFYEVTQAGPYKNLSREDFNQCLQFCSDGGYALRAYDRWKRLMQNSDGQWQLRDPRLAHSIRMNAGTIVESEKLKVRLSKRGKGRFLGEVEEYFAATLRPGDSFLIGGEIVRFEAMRELEVEVSRTRGRKPRAAVFSGTKFASTMLLCNRVLDILQQRSWPDLPDHIGEWLATQKQVSALPRPDRMLVESFRFNEKEFTCFYGFAGRNAQQTLGLILTMRMEEAGLKPLGLVSNDYAVLIWGLEPIRDPKILLSRQRVLEGLDVWLAESAVMKRTFRGIATIAGLIERNLPGKRRSGRQMTLSTDTIYDTLRKFDPNHILLSITKEQTMSGLIDFSRIENMFERLGTRIEHVQCPGVTPFAAPLLLEIGSVPVVGEAEDFLVRVESEKVLAEAKLTHV